MRFRDYLVVMSLGTIAAWVAFLMLIVSLDPVRIGAFGFVLFYLTLALAAIGTLSIAGTAIRGWFRPNDLVSRHVARAFRQAILIALLIVASLFLLSVDVFRTWTGLLLIGVVALIELAFLRSPRPKTEE